jgi:hypothetical protein
VLANRTRQAVSLVGGRFGFIIRHWRVNDGLGNSGATVQIDATCSMLRYQNISRDKSKHFYKSNDVSRIHETFLQIQVAQAKSKCWFKLPEQSRNTNQVT